MTDIGLNVIYCRVCAGRGYVGNPTNGCSYCGGTGIQRFIDERTEPMTDLKKTVRKSTTVTTTVEFDSDAIEKIFAQAAGAPKHGWSVEINEYGYTAKVTWTTTENSEEPGQ